MSLRLIALLAVPAVVWAQPGPGAVDLAASGALTAVNTDVTPATFKGRRAVRVVETTPNRDQTTVAIVNGTRLRDGAIDLELAGEVSPGASAAARGFIGVAFRVQPDAERFEYFYLRMTNGRSDDQVRRNHSTQYASHPEWPWPRLRKEFPGKYESYVDLEPGAWTRVRVEVEGARARLYVHGASQPVLVVGDLKQPEADGAVALFVGPATIGHFTDLRVNPR
jgi:hypothetical protein